MGALHCALAHRNGTTAHRCGRKPVQSGGATNDIDDGVDGANFVKGNRLDCKPVHLRFGDRKLLKDAQGKLDDAGRKR